MIPRVRTTLCLLLTATLLVICFLTDSSSFAQTATPTSVPLPKDADALSLTLADLGYEDVTLAGPYGRTIFYVGLPSHWETLPGSLFTLSLDYAIEQSMTIPAPDQGSAIPTAILDVTLNGTSVYHANLDSLGHQSVAIPLPAVWPERTGTRDRLEVFVRVLGRCEDTLVSSITISKESSLTLAYRSGPLSLDLASYPSPFYQRTFFPNTAYVVLPSQPSSQQTAAGLSLTAGLGHLTNNRLVITATSSVDWNQANPLREHLIVVGTPDNNNLISRLNDTTDLPAPLRPRRLKLNTSGPDVVAPGDSLAYILRVTNTETAPLTDLYLRSWLPYSVESVNCQPDCQIKDNQVTWKIDPLAASATATHTLTFTLPATITLDAIDLTSELVQNQEIINVNTLHSLVQPGATPTLTHAEQVGEVFFILNDRAVPETDGIVQLLPSPWQSDKAVLLVAGLTDESVFKSGRALGATSHFPGMQGQVALVQDVFQRLDEPRGQTQDITLAEMGYPDEVVIGVGREGVYYHFDLPLNWSLSRNAGVRFLFSHSPLLDPTNSSLTLLFNHTPIATTALDESNAIGGELNAPLPPQSARPGLLNTLLVQIEAHLPDPCADPDSSESWVTLDASSSLHLAHSQRDAADHFDMDFLPLPFTVHPDLADVTLALPEQPSAVEYNAALRIVSQLASASGGDNFRPAILLGDPAGADLSAHHLIVIGRPTRSPLLQEANNLLPQPFLPGTDVIQQHIDDILFRLPPDLNLGYLQLLPSKWNAERALLAVTGTSDLGVEWAAQFLSEASQLWRLEGNLALLRDEEVFTTDTRGLTASGQVAAVATAIPEATIVGTATPTPRPIPPSTAQAVEGPGGLTPSTSFPPWMIPVVIVGVLAIFVILGIAYWQARRRRSSR